MVNPWVALTTVKKRFPLDCVVGVNIPDVIFDLTDYECKVTGYQFYQPAQYQWSVLLVLDGLVKINPVFCTRVVNRP